MDATTPTVVWAHRGLGTELWLRLRSPGDGVLVLRHEDEEVQGGEAFADRLPRVRTGRNDVVVDLAGALAAGPAVAGRWRFEVRDGAGRAHALAGRRRAAAGLRRFHLTVAGGTYEAKVTAREGEVAGVTVEPHAPWAEIAHVAVEEGHLLVSAALPPGGRVPTAAVWQRRGDPSRVEVPVAADPAGVALRADLTALVPVRHGEVWDLRLRCEGDLVPLAWHHDDVGDKRRAVALPVVPLDGTDPALVVEPRFTDDDELAAVVENPGRASPTVRRDRSRRRRRADDAPEQRQTIARSGDVEAAPPRLPHRLLAVVARTVFALLAATTRRRRRRGGPVPAAPDGPVHFLVANAFGVGGTIRTTFNSANALVRRRPVTVVSAYRLEERRYFDLDPAVRQRTLVDYLWMETRPGYDPRSWLRRAALRAPSVLVHGEEPRAHRFDLWTDIQLVRWIRSVRSGTIVATRPGLNVALARFGRPGVTLIGQQHLPYEFTSGQLWQHVLPFYRDLDAMTVPTEADAEALRDRVGGAGVRVVRLPNPLSDADPPPSPLTRPCVLFAGRYNHTKGVDLLLRAFADAARAHPDWELRLYGQAKPGQLVAVREQVRALGIGDRVRFMLATPRLELELSKSSICAVSSRFEAFGMVVIEAMSCGVPVVAFDCPYGPREIITDGVDGVLVPAEDVPAFAAVLGRLMADADERRRLGAAGRRTAAIYAPDRVVGQLEDLISVCTSGR